MGSGFSLVFSFSLLFASFSTATSVISRSFVMVRWERTRTGGGYRGMGIGIGVGARTTGTLGELRGRVVMCTASTVGVLDQHTLLQSSTANSKAQGGWTASTGGPPAIVAFNYSRHFSILYAALRVLHRFVVVRVANPRGSGGSARVHQMGTAAQSATHGPRALSQPRLPKSRSLTIRYISWLNPTKS